MGNGVMSNDGSPGTLNVPPEEASWLESPGMLGVGVSCSASRCDRVSIGVRIRPGQCATTRRLQKPNILFIMGDDIGWMQPSIYHEGLMVGETPNIDRIGNEGAMFRPTTPSRVARPGVPPSSPACSRCASA